MVGKEGSPVNVKYTNGGDTLEVHAHPAGTMTELQVIVANQSTYTGSGGVADFVLTRNQAARLAVFLVQVLEVTG